MLKHLDLSTVLIYILRYIHIKGEEITGKISQLNSQDLEKKLKIMEELEINLHELVAYIKEWSGAKKDKDT